MYKIETLIEGQWVDDAVGEDNEFETEEEAKKLIPDLARIFDAPETNFRVVDTELQEMFKARR